jgi:hypothetical protein
MINGEFASFGRIVMPLTLKSWTTIVMEVGKVNKLENIHPVEVLL